MRKIVMTPEVINQVIILIGEGKSIPQIGKILGINKVTIGSYLNQHGIYMNPIKGNIRYFDNIDSYAKAYLLGFIAADGALVKTKTTTTLTITVKAEDREVLEFLKSEIGNTHNLQEIRRQCGNNPNKQIHHIRYTISDKSITEALLRVGIGYRKSLTMGNILGNIPQQFRDAFIIGYFDGDGSVTSRSEACVNDRGYMYANHSLYISIRGTADFLAGVAEHLGISRARIKSYDSIPRLDFASKKDVYRFFLCYNNLPFYFKRKHDIFLKRINHESFAKYKQGQTISSSLN